MSDMKSRLASDGMVKPGYNVLEFVWPLTAVERWRLSSLSGQKNGEWVLATDDYEMVLQALDDKSIVDFQLGARSTEGARSLRNADNDIYVLIDEIQRFFLVFSSDSELLKQLMSVPLAVHAQYVFESLDSFDREALTQFKKYCQHELDIVFLTEALSD